MWRIGSASARAIALLSVAIGIVVIALAIDNPIRDALASLWPDFVRFVRENGATLDQLWKVLGGVGTILSGCWAIYKSWRYAESNLPMRIEEFLRKCDERLVHARPLLIASIEAPRRNQNYRSPIALVGPLNDAFKNIRLGKVGNAQQDLAASIDLLTKQQKQWANFDSQIKKQLIAAHMLQGTAMAAQASMKGLTAGRDDDQKAYEQFDKAVKLDERDPEPLFYRGRQSARLGQYPLAIADFQQVMLLTNGTQSIVRARALYAESRLHTEGEKPAWQLALVRMAACVQSCPDTFKHCEEFAEMSEFRGWTQENNPQRFIAAAIVSYQVAATIFLALSSSRAKEGLWRAQQALQRLQQVETA